MKLSKEDFSKFHLDDDGEEYRQIVIDGIYTNYLISESGKIYNFVTDYYINPTEHKGRLVTGLSVNGVVHRRQVHQLVYEAFIGPIENGMTIDHVDENRLNNHWTNLEQVTRSENVIRYWNNHPIPREHLPQEMVEKICEELKKGIFYKDVASALNVNVRVVYEIVSLQSHTDISKFYTPFPESAQYQRARRNLPRDYVDSLIQQNYSNGDIAQMLGIELNDLNERYLNNRRKKYNHKFRNYYDKELLARVENLITSGKSNKEIYEMTGLEYNKPNSWMIARLRQKLQIMDFNPDGVPLDIQARIKEDMRAGMSNGEIESKYNLQRSKYVITMEARLRQAIKKESKHN